MNIIKIVFSPTGGTEKVASILADAFTQGNHDEIDLSIADFDSSQQPISPDDVCIIAVPSYGGRVPATASVRLASIKGNGAKAILVAVYGNREFEDTLIEIKDIAESAGFMPIAAIAAIAEHSISRKFASGRPDANDKAELISFAQTIINSMENPARPLIVPGNTPYKESKGSSMKPFTNDNCTQCGFCSEKCPVQAIPSEHPECTDNAVCISCMRCISICPVNARALAPEQLTFVDQFLTKTACERKSNQFFM